ncbi:hypothetical protein Pint_17680 [Pistacia integerrima]|uniref:Uncharacterized protein n=1 Tax=Pistacia integerrima TaxID=434235 RepID=A0ACC0YTW6_9ROSI|nr:hypothetical protein Pint_17680 [Pistacia integerrima]
MKLLKFSVLFQYVPRLIRIYPLFTKATRTSGKLAGAAWLKAAFNLLLYMFAGHFGMVELTDFPQKFLHCFRWGLQNLSPRIALALDAWRRHHTRRNSRRSTQEMEFSGWQNLTECQIVQENTANIFLPVSRPETMVKNNRLVSSCGLHAWSLVANLEEGTAGESSRDYKDETTSVSRIFRDVPKYISKHWLQVKKILDSQGPLGIWICLTFIVIAITLDPLFFYILVVNDDQKLRTDLYLIYKGDALDKDALKHLLHFFLIDLLAILPLPQVVILVMITTRSSSRFLNNMKLLKFFVFFQYVPRVVRIYPLFTKATRTSSGKLAEAIWPRATFNLLLYMLAGHVLGAF